MTRTIDSYHASGIASAVRALIAQHDAVMARERAIKPTVVDGHSDGRRVRYARSETAAATLRAVLAMLEG